MAKRVARSGDPGAITPAFMLGWSVMAAFIAARPAVGPTVEKESQAPVQRFLTRETRKVGQLGMLIDSSGYVRGLRAAFQAAVAQ